MGKRYARRLAVPTALVLVAAQLAACTHQYATPEEAIKHACSAFGPKALSGALIGGAAGAAGGAAIGAAAGGGKGAGYGALAGLLVGLAAGAIAGSNADERDCKEAQAALQRLSGAQTGNRIAWNSVTGSYGAFTPTSDTKDVNGKVCREIRSDYFIKNHQPVLGEPGLVCRTDTGDWARVGAPS